MVKTTDKLPDHGTPEFEGVIGKIRGFLLRMLKRNFNVRMYAVLDLGFCDLMTIIALYKKGIYARELIKKHCYWLTFVPSAAIDV